MIMEYSDNYHNDEVTHTIQDDFTDQKNNK